MQYDKSDQWLLDGDCSVCRRRNYCNKQCKSNVRRRRDAVTGAIVSMAAKVYVDAMKSTRRKYNMSYTKNDSFGSRKTFAIINGELHWLSEDSSYSSSREWILNEFPVNVEQFEDVIRGSLFKDHITICKGSNYNKINIDELPDGILREIVAAGCAFAGVDSIEVWNGQVVGKIGMEWPPIENLGKMTAEA